MELEPFNLAEGFCRQLTLTIISTAYHRNILYHQQVSFLATGSANAAVAGTFAPTDAVNHLTLSHRLGSAPFAEGLTLVGRLEMMPHLPRAASAAFSRSQRLISVSVDTP